MVHFLNDNYRLGVKTGGFTLDIEKLLQKY